MKIYLSAALLSLPLIFSSQSALAAPEYHNPEKITAELKNHPNPGKAVYEQFCKVCHASKPMISLGAPSIGDLKAWKPRAQQDFTSLLNHVYNGYNAMPARGGCFECSDALLKAATLYLLPDALRSRYERHH